MPTTTAKKTPLSTPTIDLAADDAAGIVDVDVLGRQRAHRDGHGLRAGIAAHARRRSASARPAPPSARSSRRTGR